MQKTLQAGGSGVPASETWIATLIEISKARYAQYRTYRQTIRELSALSDRALSDLGLSRSMIKPLARETAYGA